MYLSKWKMVFPFNAQNPKQTKQKPTNQKKKQKNRTKTQPLKKVLPRILSAGKDGWNWVLKKILIDRMYTNLHLLCKIMGIHIYN